MECSSCPGNEEGPIVTYKGSWKGMIDVAFIVKFVDMYSIGMFS